MACIQSQQQQQQQQQQVGDVIFVDNPGVQHGSVKPAAALHILPTRVGPAAAAAAEAAAAGD
jgi:alpha-ketoglutarate-dependent taurine dioxygenase